MKPKLGIQVVGWLLAAVSVLLLLVSWRLYPEENAYSVLRCTISYLGSPDPDRNPEGWRFYQVGMTSWIVLMSGLLLRRQARALEAGARTAVVGGWFLFLGILLLFAAVWIPDSRTTKWGEQPLTRIHTQLALVAIPVFGAGLTLDSVGVFLAGMRFRELWPSHLFAVLAATGFGLLWQWERMCQADRTLRHWPGDGLHSTPLWEWILFLYLSGHVVWMASRRIHRASRGNVAPPGTV